MYIAKRPQNFLFVSLLYNFSDNFFCWFKLRNYNTKNVIKRPIFNILSKFFKFFKTTLVTMAVVCGRRCHTTTTAIATQQTPSPPTLTSLLSVTISSSLTNSSDSFFSSTFLWSLFSQICQSHLRLLKRVE